jgi:DNA-binding response OmpR family regulator
VLSKRRRRIGGEFELGEAQAHEVAESASERRVAILEADTINRFSTERLLRKEDYWIFATDDPAAIVRTAAVSAVDLVLVDLGLNGLEAVPRWQRRRGDAVFRGVPAGLADGYAVLRPLLTDPACARFPVVTLKIETTATPTPACRFGVVEFLPRPYKSGGLVEGLDSLFRELIVPNAHGEFEPPPSAHHAFASTPTALRTALVVDPDAGERRTATEVLLRHDFTVHQAATSAEALRLAIARRPWLVITEMSLPDESGIVLCGRMRSNSLLRRTPIVFLSSRDDCETRFLAMKAGADEFLAKPTPSRELLIRLELLLKRFGELELGEDQGAVLRGVVELVGAPAVLQICHLNQLTGVLLARRGSYSVRIAFRGGQIVAATGPDHGGAQAVYDFIAWPQGQFEFERGAVVDAAPIDADFNGLLLEGCRRLDERRRGRPEAARI